MKREIKSKFGFGRIRKNKERIMMTHEKLRELKNRLYNRTDNRGVASNELLQETVIELIDILDEFIR